MSKKKVASVDNTNIVEVNALNQYRTDYTRYAKYLVTSRVCPNIADGLKPVGRRIVYGALSCKSLYTKTKAARWVGDVMGKYHPHGDSSIYGSMVTMACQGKAYEPIVEGFGNWGTPGGGVEASFRYTEAKLSDFGREVILAESLEIPETINWVRAYTDQDNEPEFYQPKLPLLLINGSSAIGVGIAQSVPPHPIADVGKAVVQYIDNPKKPIVLVPDQCMPCDIIDTDWDKISATGFGKFKVRARSQCFDKLPGSLCPKYEGNPGILFTSTPDQVKMESVVEQLNDKIAKGAIKIPELIDILQANGKQMAEDEDSTVNSSFELNYVFCLKKGADPKYVRDLLYKYTSLQTTISVNVNVIGTDYTPIQVGYKAIIEQFLNNRINSKYKYYGNKRRKVRTKFHEKDAFIKILSTGKEDVVINRIKSRKTKEEVEETYEWLIKTFNMTDLQARFIMQAKLTYLSQAFYKDLVAEAKALKAEDDEYLDKLTDEKKILAEIKQETIELCKKYGRPRRCNIISEADINDIPKGTFKLVITNSGLIKKLPENMSIGSFKDDKPDFVVKVDNTKGVFIFDSCGKVFKYPVWKIPTCDKKDKGMDIRLLMKNLTNPVAVIPEEHLMTASKLKVKHFLTVVTLKSKIKRLEIEDILGASIGGIAYHKLDTKDRVKNVLLIGNGLDIVTYSGSKVLRFNTKEISVLRRMTSGVKCMEADIIDGAVQIGYHKDSVVVVTSNGYINKIPQEAVKTGTRGNKGSAVIKLGRGDSLLSLFSCDQSNIIVAEMMDGNTVEIPVKDIETGSTISKGKKLFPVNTLNKIIRCIVK